MIPAVPYPSISGRQLFGGEVAFEDEDSGNLIDYGFVLGSGASGGVQVSMSLGSGEALVPEVDGEVGFIAEKLGEGLGFSGLGALVSGHI